MVKLQAATRLLAADESEIDKLVQECTKILGKPTKKGNDYNWTSGNKADGVVTFEIKTDPAKGTMSYEFDGPAIEGKSKDFKTAKEFFGTLKRHVSGYVPKDVEPAELAFIKKINSYR